MPVPSQSKLGGLWQEGHPAWVWHGSNGVGHISEVTVHQARLVLGWMAVFGWYISHPGQLSLLSSAGQEMSTMVLSSWGIKAGTDHSICGCMCGWQVNPCDSSLSCAIPEHLRGGLDSVQSAVFAYSCINRIVCSTDGYTVDAQCTV